MPASSGVQQGQPPSRPPPSSLAPLSSQHQRGSPQHRGTARSPRPRGRFPRVMRLGHISSDVPPLQGVIQGLRTKLCDASGSEHPCSVRVGAGRQVCSMMGDPTPTLSSPGQCLREGAKRMGGSPGAFGSVVRVSAHRLEGCGFNSSQGRVPQFAGWIPTQVGACEATNGCGSRTTMLLSVPFPLPSRSL